MFLAIASSHYLMFAVHFVVVGGSGKSLKLIKVREHNTKKEKRKRSYFTLSPRLKPKKVLSSQSIIFSFAVLLMF